ncbi:hypothetical protein GP486_007785 [Trichoglossum hirsutum]|uniref:Pyruvate dehydrogenase protein x component n=1 Tax=Trichoglossum hirsutum TaxID=265104 RepID=A0A9P8IB67_9PEZI|nr:hypothetical protein GP486_007785 [Trichoglossum hirsutum]
MATFAAVYRLSVRVAGGQLRNHVVARDISSRAVTDGSNIQTGLRTSTADLAAQNFAMPAMSPTMTEGNIGTWKVKEGETFSAGDVLLEIETDKAQIDVEAQEDGKLAKIILGDGTKGIKVGSRIAVVSDVNDDLSTLEIPSEEPAPAPSPQKQPAAPDTAKAESKTPSKPQPPRPATPGLADQSSTGTPSKQRLPLLPSVAYLLQSHNLPASEADKIPATGPSGRLLKGDVLAYIGSIPHTYPKSLSDSIVAREHLDLSNIKIRVPTPTPPQQPETTAETASPPPPRESKIGVSIDLSGVMKVQQRIERKLGIHMPLSTFIARATDIANDDLPRSVNTKPSQDDLFNHILGLDALVPRTARGNLTPHVNALPTSPTPTQKQSTRTSDIIDILTSTTAHRAPAAGSRGQSASPLSAHAPTNVISVTVPAGDERRGRVFLGRVKSYLESEPGRLVL